VLLQTTVGKHDLKIVFMRKSKRICVTIFYWQV